MRSSLPLRVSIPLVLGLLGAVLTGIDAVHDWVTSNQAVERSQWDRATSLCQIVVPNIERAMLQGDMSAVADAVARLALESNLSVALVCDETDRVLHATDFSLRGRELSATPVASAASLVRRVRAQRRGQAEITADGAAVETAFPFYLPTLPGELRPSRLAVLFTRTDMLALKQAARLAILRRALLMGSVGLVACVGVWLYLRATFTRYLDELVAGVVAYEADDGELRVPVDGNPEVARIGRALRGMFAELEEKHGALQRAVRELRAVSDCNQVLVRATDETALLNDVCRIVCEGAGYCMAWVGYAEHDAARTIRPVAWAGTEQGYLEAAGLVWSDTERGRGPTGTAIRTGQSAISQDFAVDSNLRPWRDAALERGYRSSVALPLKDKSGAAFGALSIYSSQVNAFTPDEVRLLEELAGDLAFGIVVLRDRLERDRAEKEVRQLNLELDERVRQRTAMLEAANRELESVCYSVSHDLRTPLRSIDGFSRIVMEECGDHLDDASRENLGIVRSAARRMGQLIDDLLRLSRINRGEMRWTDVDLSQTAARMADRLQRAEPGRRVEFVIAPGCRVRGDAALLGIALENVLGNAWKYTSQKADAKIELGVERTGAGDVFFVRDNGCGFDMSCAHKLFSPFERLHTAAEFPGTGIGLACVQRVMQRHGGRAWIEGKVGVGTTLYFTLTGGPASANATGT